MADLDALVAALLESRKYRTVAPEFVRKIADQESRKHSNFKAALKASKNRLHQLVGAYLSEPPAYDSWAGKLASAQTPDDLRAVCRALMQTHASARERLPILDDFYGETLAEIAPVHSILDVACGLNPLAIPFMPLADDAVYFACDIYTDLAEFLTRIFPLLGVTGSAWAADVTEAIPAQPVDLALIVKAIPCLQQIDKAIGARLLEGIQARHILVSYPAQSLGGKGKGMRSNYETQFAGLVAGRGWTIRRFDFATELAFLITK